MTAEFMKIYRNNYSTEGGGSAGFSFHASKRDARLAAKRPLDEPPHAVAELFILKPGKKALLRFLNCYAGHPDNG